MQKRVSGVAPTCPASLQRLSAFGKDGSKFVQQTAQGVALHVAHFHQQLASSLWTAPLDILNISILPSPLGEGGIHSIQF